jgi:glycosyl transferase family 25
MSNNIDKIFYINLNRRIDRKEHIEKELNNFNLKYERFEAIETPGCGIIGCGLSHLQVLKIAKERNYKNVLILEDDFQFIVTKEEFEKELHDFFELNLDYDVCFLSYRVLVASHTTYPNVNKVLESQTASGYIVSNKYYDSLIQLYETAIPLLEATRMHWLYANDQVWKELQRKDNWFYLTKRIGKQIPSYSDNGECFIDIESLEFSEPIYE